MFTIKSVISNHRRSKTNWVFATIFSLFLFTVISPITFVQANEITDSSAYKELMPYYYAAARTGDNDVITEFLNAGLPVDIKNHKGYTALMIA